MLIWSLQGATVADKHSSIQLSFKAGETILHPTNAASPNHIYQVASGLVKIFQVNNQGDNFILRYVSPGEFFGEESLIDLERRYYVEAVIDTNIYIININNLYLSLANDMAIDLLNNIDNIYKSIQQISSFHLQSRLAAMLLELANYPIANRDSRGQTIIRITHDELAALAGAARESITKIIGEFAKMGLIKSGYGWLRLTNAKQLQQLASEDKQQK